MKLLIGTIALVMALPASAAPSVSLTGPRSTNTSWGLRDSPPSFRDDRICLARKLSRAVECRTRAEWVKVAARLSRAEASRP
jgi:hypothetical protein